MYPLHKRKELLIVPEVSKRKSQNVCENDFACKSAIRGMGV
jgi:hypothetical protein